MFETVLRRLAPFAQEFSSRGKSVYLVGGAVRNLILGRAVQDYDFTTDARPEEVQTYFRKVLPTGLQHGTVTVLFQGNSYEVTTFRVDGDYSDGRRPDQVTYTPSLEEDLKRRDFTINAMALNLVDGTLSDPHDGRGDLSRGVIRAIGDPGRRFDEDALRLLRLFRFSSQLGFSIDNGTLAAVAPRRKNLAAVSRERIREELTKAMAGPCPDRAWGPLSEMGFWEDLFSPLSPRPLSSVETIRLVSLPPGLRWSFWMTLTGGHDRSLWEKCLRNLTFSNSEIASVLGPALVWDHSSLTPLSVRAKATIEAWGSRDRASLGIDYLRALEEVGYWNDDGLVRELIRASTSGEPIFLSELALGGKDLLKEGLAPGPKLGRVLKQLQWLVWEDPKLNASEDLIRRVKVLL